METFQMN